MGDYYGYDNHDDWFCAEQDKINEERREREEEERRRAELREQHDRETREMWDREKAYYDSILSSNNKNGRKSDYDDYSSSYNDDSSYGSSYVNYSNSNRSGGSVFKKANDNTGVFSSIGYGIIAFILAQALWLPLYHITAMDAEWELLLIIISAAVSHNMIKHKNMYAGIPLTLLFFLFVHESSVQSGIFNFFEIMPVMTICMLLSVGTGYLFKKNLGIPAWVVIGLNMFVAMVPFFYIVGWHENFNYILFLIAGAVFGLILGVFKKMHLEFVTALLIGLAICCGFYIYQVDYFDFSFLPSTVWFLGLLLVVYSVQAFMSKLKEKK